MLAAVDRATMALVEVGLAVKVVAATLRVDRVDRVEKAAAADRPKAGTGSAEPRLDGEFSRSRGSELQTVTPLKHSVPQRARKKRLDRARARSSRFRGACRRHKGDGRRISARRCAEQRASGETLAARRCAEQRGRLDRDTAHGARGSSSD